MASAVSRVIDVRQVPPHFRDTWVEEQREQAQDVLDRLITQAALPVEAEPIIAEGLTHQRIVEAARNHEVGLIVMASSGLSALDRLLLGSVTERVLRTAPCPLLVHRS